MDNRHKALSRILSPKTLFFATLAVLAVPNVALCFTERMGFWASAANIVLPMAVVWLLLTLTQKPGKAALLLFPLMFFAAFQTVLLYLFGHSIIAVDMFLNLVTTNPGEAMELLDNLVPAVSLVIVVYVPVIALAIISLHRGDRLGHNFLSAQRKMAAAAVGAGAVCLGAGYAADRDYAAGLDLYPVNVLYNLALAVERTEATADYARTSAHFSFHAKDGGKGDAPRVFVLVIGETARADNFALYGYSRNTTPMLQREKGLTAFSKALTQSNTTHKSVPMLMSAVSAENYDSIYREKGIITAFKEAGYHTTFISNQRPNHSFIDLFGEEADRWTFIKDHAANPETVTDEQMLALVDKVLAKGRRRELIVLHTYGSHFNYRERYSRSEAFFKPDEASEAEPGNRAQLLNAYDNTIRCTDKLLAGVIARIGSKGRVAAMVYASDHGENIFDDDRKLFLHASPVPSYYELHVPLIVWLSPEYISAYPQIAAALNANRHKDVATSVSVFHTLLNIAHITTPLRNDRLSVADASYTPRPAVYLNDHNRAVPVSKILRDAQDFSMMRYKGIRTD